MFATKYRPQHFAGVVPRIHHYRKTMYQRKTKIIYVIQGDYGQGWEDVAEENTREEAEDRLKAYWDNMTTDPHQIITRSIHID